MAEDYTLILLGEMALAMLAFCMLAAHAYFRVRKYKKDITHLTGRATATQQKLAAVRQEFHAIRQEADGRLSQNEMEHSVSLFSMHVLHHLPKPASARKMTATRTKAIKAASRSKAR